METLKGYSDKNEIAFPLLSDEGSKTIDAFGIRNKQYTDPEHDWYGIPHPGTYLVDDRGIVTGKIFYGRYQPRHTGEDLLDLAKKLDG